MCFNCITREIETGAYWAALEATSDLVTPETKKQYITALAGLHVLAELLKRDREAAIAVLGRIAHGEEPAAAFLSRFESDPSYWQDINNCLQEP